MGLGQLFKTNMFPSIINVAERVGVACKQAMSSLPKLERSLTVAKIFGISLLQASDK